MSIASTVARGRRLAESAMATTGTVTRVTGTTTDGNGRETPATQTVYYGPAKVSAGGLSAMSADAAGRQVTIQRPQIHFPVGAFAMRVGDVFTVTDNPPDPSMVGRRYRLTAEAPAQTWATAYRVSVEEII